MIPGVDFDYFDNRHNARIGSSWRLANSPVAFRV